MPTTSNFGWTTPADTDLVKDGAAAIRTLGSAIDTSLVDLKGGTTGQVLAKASNTDMDFTWSSVDPLTILDAKGDLITATAADTPARLAVGTNGQVLTADSTTATGLKWAAAGGGVNHYIPTGRTLYVKSNQSASANTTAVEDVTYYSLVYLPTCTIDRIGALTASSFSGSSTVRLGIYNNGSNNLPTTVLLDAGTVNFLNPGESLEITVSQSVSAGIYWLAFNSQSVASPNTYIGANGSVTAHNFLMGELATAIGGNQLVGYSQTGVTGAFATASSLVDTTSNVPNVYVRVS